MSLPLILGLIVGLLVLAAAGVFGLMAWLRKRANAQLEEIKQRYPAHELRMIAPAAALIGRKGPDGAKLGGNGSLVLTRTELAFMLWLPKREIVIPLHRIRRAEAADSFAGKPSFRPLLKVVYRGEADAEEELAFYAPEIESWVKALGR